MTEEQIRITELGNKLIAADALARAVDKAVESGALGSRSEIADARLNYGQPFTYEFTPAE